MDSLEFPICLMRMFLERGSHRNRGGPTMTRGKLGTKWSQAQKLNSQTSFQGIDSAVHWPAQPSRSSKIHICTPLLDLLFCAPFFHKWHAAGGEHDLCCCRHVTEVQFNCSFSPHLQCRLWVWSPEAEACKKRVDCCMVSRWLQWLRTWQKHGGPKDNTQLHFGLKQCEKKQEVPLFMLLFSFVWKEDGGSLGNKLFPLSQAQVRCYCCHPPFQEWLDSVGLRHTRNLSAWWQPPEPESTSCPHSNFFFLLFSKVLSRLQSPVPFLPPFLPHFSFQCFFFLPRMGCNRVLCQQAGCSSWPSSARPPCGSIQWVACGQVWNQRSFPTWLFWALSWKRRRGYLGLLSLCEVEKMNFCTMF